jgi:hypothetical protein
VARLGTCCQAVPGPGEAGLEHAPRAPRLLAILESVEPEVLDKPPAWALPTKDNGNGWVLLADLAFPIADDGRTLKTCIARGGVNEKGRERLNRMKRRRPPRKPLYLRGRRAKEEAWH